MPVWDKLGEKTWFIYTIYTEKKYFSVTEKISPTYEIYVFIKSAEFVSYIYININKYIIYKRGNRCNSLILHFWLVQFIPEFYIFVRQTRPIFETNSKVVCLILVNFDSKKADRRCKSTIVSETNSVSHFVSVCLTRNFADFQLELVTVSSWDFKNCCAYWLVSK